MYHIITSTNSHYSWRFHTRVKPRKYCVSIYHTRFPSGTCLREWRKNEQKNVQHETLYHTHMISCYDVIKYLCCSTCGNMHVSHSSRDPQAYRSQGPITKATRKPQQSSAGKLPLACGVASCSAGRRQACIALYPAG